MDKQKTITVKLVSLKPFTPIEPPEHASGWGEVGVSETVSVKGEIAQITVHRGDRTSFGLRILEDGSFILTSYDTWYTTTVEQNARFTNGRPWK